MDKYFFVLGRYPSVSVAEIKSVLKKNNIDFTLLRQSLEIAVFSASNASNLQEIFNSLGGSIKYGPLLGEASLDDKETSFLKYLEAAFLKENVIPKGINKVHFGISIYDGGADKLIAGNLADSIFDFNRTIKENLKADGIASGFLRIKEKKLSSVAVVKNQLLTKGFELILIAAPDKVIIGKTRGVQDFSSFTFRDMNRPLKDKKSGILPVKLARIMVNLLGFTPQTLLDPFCGSGTVLMEAALLGVKNIIGTDIENRAINDSSTNMEWLYKEFNINPSEIKIRFRTSDVRSLDKITGVNITDSIVTEPYLGPPLHKLPDEAQSQRIFSQLTPLYNETMNVCYRLLKNNGKIVIIFPFHQASGKNYFMDKKVINPAKFKPEQSLLYSSPGQFVGREILVLAKV